MAIGIIGVVGGHCGIEFFPWFQSYRMPLFIFISGYFFKNKKFCSFVLAKIKHLIIPLLLWNLFFGVLCTLLLHYGLISFGSALSFKTLFIQPFTHGHQFILNFATWFVGTLVELQLLYWVLYRICKGNHIFLTLISLVCYWAAYMMADLQWHKMYGGCMLAAEKVLILLIYYELGYLYRLYWEKKDYFSVNKIAALAIFNGSIIGFAGGKIWTMYSWMNVADHAWIPIAVALSGIYFSLQIAEYLKDKVGRNSLFGYIGEHTFSIMTLHVLFLWLLNTVFWKMKEFGWFTLRSFDYDKYMHLIWFRVTEHEPMAKVFYFLVGLFGSLLCVYLYERFAEPRLKKYFRFL